MQVDREIGSHGRVDRVSSCEHCGTKFNPTKSEERFCCSGCEYVYRIIHDEALEKFYDLRGKVSRPVGATVFDNTDFPWLAELRELAESQGEVAKLKLALEGISCVGCVWLIDRVFSSLKGAISCRVNVQFGTLDIEWESGGFDLVGFAARLKQFGYRVCPAQESRESESRNIVWKLGLSGAFALNGMLYALPGYLGMESDFLVASHFSWLSAIFATVSMLFCGSYFLGRAIKAAYQKVAHLDLPISIGLVFAYTISWYGVWQGDEQLIYFDFVTTFIFLMLVGRWLQVVAVERNRSRLADIQLESPQVEIESSNGNRIKTRAEQIRVGEVYWLPPGQRVPVRSRLLSERASLGMDWISGESESRIVESGGETPSGAELENQFAVRLEAEEEWTDALLCKLTTRDTRSKERDLVAQKWIFRYLCVAFAVACIGGATWMLAGNFPLGLKAFISVLVVSCPCALGIAWPFADEIALARLKQQGVFLTTHSLWNRLSKLQRIVFDKTGTLTRSSLSLVNPESISDLPRDGRVALSTLCSKSRHPISNTIREFLMAKGEYQPAVLGVLEETVGSGVEWREGSTVWHLGKDLAESEPAKGTFLSCNGRPLREFIFEDTPLPDAACEVQALRDRGLKVSILSGDRIEKARRIGHALGLQDVEVLGELRPEEKSEWIATHQPEVSMMIGDGANDTLAFETALCSGAPANEQGVVAEKADFHYLGNGIGGIRSLLETGGRRQKAIRRLLSFALTYNLVAVGFSVAGWVTPLVAAILMPISSIVSLAVVWSTFGKR